MDPAATPTTPRVYLSLTAAAVGNSSPTSTGSSSTAAGFERYGPSPMSTSSTVPAQSLPAPTYKPALPVPNVTVSPARTAGPVTAPVSASTPLGTSTAT